MYPFYKNWCKCHPGRTCTDSLRVKSTPLSSLSYGAICDSVKTRTSYPFGNRVTTGLCSPTTSTAIGGEQEIRTLISLLAKQVHRLSANPPYVWNTGFEPVTSCSQSKRVNRATLIPYIICSIRQNTKYQKRNTKYQK